MMFVIVNVSTDSTHKGFRKMNERILCVEDDEDTCELLSFSLGKAGYEVVSAYTFADGLAKALSGSFKVILLDSHLPDGSGIELCKQIRETGSHTPVIFYSAD